MTNRLFTSWYLLLFYLRETRPFQSGATRWLLCVLFLVPWVSLRRTGFGRMHLPHGLLAPYRSAQQARFAGLVRSGRLPAGMSPDQIAAAFAPAADPFAARIHVTRAHRLVCKVVAKRGKRHLYYCHRTLDPDRKAARHDFLVVHPRFRAAGDLARILAASLALYDRIGLHLIELTAGLSVGGSLWPKYGFVPDADQWEAVIATIRRNLATLPAADIAAYDRQPGIPAPLRTLVERLCDPARPANIILIREIRLPDGAQAAGTPPLGARLLSGARWRGSLDLRDPARRKRLERCIGL